MAIGLWTLLRVLGERHSQERACQWTRSELERHQAQRDDDGLMICGHQTMSREPIYRLVASAHSMARDQEQHMNWQDLNWRALLNGDVLFLPPSAKTVSQKEINALDAKRAQRLRELGKWRPSRGWRIDPSPRTG